MNKIVLFCCLMGLGACVDTVPTSVLKDAPEAKLVVAEKIMSPEERAIENKIANRTLLQKVVDESEKFDRIELPYTCGNSSGGLLTFIKDKNQTKGIRFVATEEGWNEFVGLYYKKEELIFAVYEKSEWKGDQEEHTQTIFYLDKGEVFRCMQKKARGTTAQMERLIKSAEFESIAVENRLMSKLLTYQDLFNSVHQDNITSKFCP